MLHDNRDRVLLDTNRHRVVDDHVMDEMWRDYRVADFQLGRSKQDIGDTLTETEQHTENLREQLEKIKAEGRFEVEELERKAIPFDPAA